MTNHILSMAKELFDLVDKEIKTLDVRAGYAQIKKIKKGDTIEYFNGNMVKFKVVRIAIYKDIEEMIEKEDHTLILPKKTKNQVFNNLRKVYVEEKERLGIYVFELVRIIDLIKDVKLIKVSDIIRKNKPVSDTLIKNVYATTISLKELYPKYSNWYMNEVVPGLTDGSYEIVICTANKNVAGIAILKKHENEKKICTFFIVQKFKKSKIKEKLLKKCFEILNTTKPLISISESEIDIFEKLIVKYEWKQTEVFYNDKYKEFVFNGKIS